MVPPTMNLDLRLVSFALCPYVQRAVIMLREKNTPHRTEYVDLQDKPDWFLQLSPRGKVPVLVADGIPIFESHAICEFLEEIVPEPPMFPSDPVLRARDRAWFVFASEDLLSNQYALQYEAEEAKVKKAILHLETKYARLEKELQGRSFLSGDGTRFGLADVACAPALYKARDLKKRGLVDLLAKTPHVMAWSERILSRPSVENSVPEDYEARFDAGLAQRGGWLVQHHQVLGPVNP